MRPTISDSVDLLWAWQESLGVSITQSDPDMMRSTSDAIELFASRLAATGTRSACLTLRAFNRFRVLLASAGIARSRIRPAARLRDVVPRRIRKKAWDTVRSSPEFSELPPFRFGVGRIFAPITVADAFYTAMAYSAHSLKQPGEPWTHAEIRSVVRAGVREISGLSEFSDDAEIVRDLRHRLTVI